MKKPSNELYLLVQSLNLSEKRYCSIYLARHSTGEANRYLRLFELLKEQSAYDSAAAMQALGYATQPGHYAVLKKQLYEQLLDALHQFDLFTNPVQQLFRGIHQCHLLLQKGLFTQCEKRIKTLSATAVEMNQYEAQLQLQSLKMMMKARSYYRQVSEGDLKEWLMDTTNLLSDINVTMRYRYAGGLVYKMQYEAGGRGKELAARMEKVMALPEFKEEKQARTLSALLDFHQVKALYNFANLHPEEALKHNEQFLALLDKNPQMRQLHADRYFSVLNNFLIDCLVLKKYPVLEEGLQKLRSLSKIPAFKRLANIEANVFRLGYLLEMNYMITTGNFKQAYKQVPLLQQGLSQYAEKIVKHNRLTLQYLSAYTCFALAKYDEALDHLWPILQEKETAVAEDIQVAARMMQLLAHFEKGDNMLLDSLIKGVRRLLKNDETSSVQRQVLSFVNSSLRKPEITAAYGELQKKLEKLAANPAAAGSFNLFNYPVWVKAHQAGKPFADMWE